MCMQRNEIYCSSDGSAVMMLYVVEAVAFNNLHDATFVCFVRMICTSGRNKSKRFWSSVHAFKFSIWHSNALRIIRLHIRWRCRWSMPFSAGQCQAQVRVVPVPWQWQMWLDSRIADLQSYRLLIIFIQLERYSLVWTHAKACANKQNRSRNKRLFGLLSKVAEAKRRSRSRRRSRRQTDGDERRKRNKWSIRRQQQMDYSQRLYFSIS